MKNWLDSRINTTGLFCNHHRPLTVVWIVEVCLLCFRIVCYCLTKAMMLIHIWLESLLLALSLDIYKTFFIFKAGSTPQDAYSWHQFLPLQKFFDWNFILYLLPLRTHQKLQAHETDFFSLAFRSIVQVRREFSPTNIWNAVDWSVVEGSNTFVYVHQFCWLFWTKHCQAWCEHLNRAVAGRSHFNCHCEGLIVFLFFQNSIQKYMFTSCLKNR